MSNSRELYQPWDRREKAAGVCRVQELGIPDGTRNLDSDRELGQRTQETDGTDHRQGGAPSDHTFLLPFSLLPSISIG